jgi:nicotinate-nucleotide adenylyltransferase
MGFIAGVSVSDIERELGGDSRTLYTIEALLEQQPDRALRLIIGSDVLPDLPKWHRFDRIAELAPPIVIGRAGFEHPDAPLAVLPEVSSTQIRERCRDGRLAEVKSVLPRAVRDYLVQHRLYQSEAS